MDRKQKQIALIVAVAVAALCWCFRFKAIEIHANATPAAYLVNRWTGAVYFLAPTFIRELRQDPPAPAYSGPGSPTFIPFDTPGK